MKQRNYIWFAVVSTALLAGCGDGAGTPTGGAASRAASAPSGDASAEDVAAEAREDLDCPARVKTPGPVAGAPVADVLGVRPGMRHDEARDVVLCTHDLLVTDATVHRFNLNTHGQEVRQGFGARFAKARVTKSSREYMREMSDDMIARSNNAVRHDMQPGEVKWYVGTMGVPGEERVLSVAREEWFADGKQPAVETVAAALTKKYGTPQRTRADGPRRQMSWVYDPADRAAPPGSRALSRCHGMADPDGGVNLSPDCGVVVEARIQSMPDNPGLARYLQVGVVDPARGYELLTTTEARLAGLEEQRRARQVEEAAKNADAPAL